MKKISKFADTALALQGSNIDTDQIIPARFLKKDRTLAGGYGPYLFHDLRYDKDGNMLPNFVLNQHALSDAAILVAEHNFGCGSSREGAVYALVDSGFKAVIAPSFGDIFYNNSLKNGLLPIQLDEKVVMALIELLHHDPAQRTIQIDLEQNSVQWELAGNAGTARHHFSLDPFWQECLLKGLDEVELTLSYLNEIAMFESRYLSQNPWNKGPSHHP